MASRSGARQTLAVSPVQATPAYTALTAPGRGYSGMNLTPVASTFENVGNGLSTMHKSGFRQTAGAFTIAADATTLPLLLGANGQRRLFRRRNQGDGAGLPEETFEGILQVTRALVARGRSEFRVAVTVDGAVARGTQ